MNTSAWNLVVENQALPNWLMTRYRKRLTPQTADRLEIVLQSELERVASVYDQSKGSFSYFYKKCASQTIARFFAGEVAEQALLAVVAANSVGHYVETPDVEEDQRTELANVEQWIEKAAADCNYDQYRMRLIVAILSGEKSLREAGAELNVTQEGVRKMVLKIKNRVLHYANSPVAA